MNGASSQGKKRANPCQLDDTSVRSTKPTRPTYNWVRTRLVNIMEISPTVQLAGWSVAAAADGFIRFRALVRSSMDGHANGSALRPTTCGDAGAATNISKPAICAGTRTTQPGEADHLKTNAPQATFTTHSLLRYHPCLARHPLSRHAVANEIRDTVKIQHIGWTVYTACR